MKLITDDINFLAWYEGDKGVQVLPAKAFADRLKRRLFQPPDKPKMVTGWEKMLGKFDLRESEMTVWAGPNGQGKSMATTQMALALCEQGLKVGIASMEMPPDATLARMACMAYGTKEPTEKMVDDFIEWTGDRLWLYDRLGSVNPKEMIGISRYVASDLELDHWIVDNLQKCIEGEDDYNGQKDFTSRLFDITKDTRMHIHLVHHTKKVEGIPRKSDVKGASSITDLVDNVVMVYRNVHKEEVFSGTISVKNYDEVMSQPDFFLDLVKQRHGEFQGKFGFWDSMDCPQFVETRGAPAKKYRMTQEVDVGEIF